MQERGVGCQGQDRNAALIPNTVTFEYAPSISKRFAVKAEGNFSFEPDEPLLLDFLKWEKQFHNYEKMYKKYSGSGNAADVEALNELQTVIEKIEIELQCSAVILK